MCFGGIHQIKKRLLSGDKRHRVSIVSPEIIFLFQMRIGGEVFCAKRLVQQLLCAIPHPTQQICQPKIPAGQMISPHPGGVIWADGVRLQRYRG
jgi:hypothetical protein